MSIDNYKALGFHKQFSARLANALRTTGAPFQHGVHANLPVNGITGTHYNSTNILSLYLSMEQIAKNKNIPIEDLDRRWMTLANANKMGFKVEKGSVSTPIAYYTWTKQETMRDVNGDPVIKDGKEERQTIYLDKPLLAIGHVFHATQIDMELEPKVKKTPEQKQAALDRAEALITASGAVFIHDAKCKEAFYDRFQDRIYMPLKESYPSKEALLAEQINQLSYWSGHKDRLNRETGPNGTTYRSREELTTAIGTWVVLNTLGLEGASFNSRNRHVQGMARLLEANPFEAMQCCKNADKIREHMLNLEWTLETSKTKETEIETGTKLVAVGQTTQSIPGLKVMTPEQELADALANAGLELGGKSIMWNGIPQDIDNGTYTATKGNPPEALIHNTKTGHTVKWIATGHKLTQESIDIQKETTKKIHRERKRSRNEKKQDMSNTPAPVRGKGQERGLLL